MGYELTELEIECGVTEKAIDDVLDKVATRIGRTIRVTFPAEATPALCGTSTGLLQLLSSLGVYPVYTATLQH